MTDTVDKLKEMMKHTAEGVKAERRRCLKIIQQPCKMSVPAEQLEEIRKELERIEKQHGWAKAYELATVTAILEVKKIMATNVLNGLTEEDIDAHVADVTDKPGWFFPDPVEDDE